MDRESGFEVLQPRDYLTDQETDLLVGLPDYHKMKLADVDVIERTVNKCRPLAPTKVKKYKWMDEVPDQVIVDTCGPASEELEIHNMIEEGVSATEEEPELVILRGLDKLLKRIEILQCDIRLRQKLNEGSSESQAENKVAMQKEYEELNKCQGFPRHLAEIRLLQRAQHQLQCQITELLCRYAHLRTQKRALIQQLGLVQERIAIIRELSSVNQKWMQDTAEELTLCRKRSRQIVNTKLTKQLAREVTETNIWSSFRYSQRYLFRNLVARHMNDLSDEIEELRRYTDELTHEIERRVACVTKKAAQMGRLSQALGAPDGNGGPDDKQQSILKQSSKYKGLAAVHPYKG